MSSDEDIWLMRIHRQQLMYCFEEFDTPVISE